MSLTKDFKNNAETAPTIEDELEALALSFGRSREKFSKEGEDEVENEDEELEEDLSLKILPNQELQKFADFKLVSIHPRIKSKIEIELEELKNLTSDLKKLIKHI